MTHCPKCSAEFVCSNCSFALRKVPRDAVVTSRVVTVMSPELQGYLRTVAQFGTYRSSFERGPRGGAMIQFGRIRLECFVPYLDDEFDLPFMPMELDGSPVHDQVRSTDDECSSGRCGCDRPTGWRLTRPILRAILGVTDAFLNDHASELPGRLPGWRLAVATKPFMTECYFNPEFAFPTRAACRAARRAMHRRRQVLRKSGLKRG